MKNSEHAADGLVAGRVRRAASALGHIVLVWALWRYLAFLFQVEGLRLPAAGIGPWTDAYFVNFVLEQWAHAARTLSDPASPPMFHPIGGTLGYSHSLILYAPLYIAARTRLPPFQAETFMLLVVFGLGIICLYLMLRRCTGIAALPAAALTALVASSPNIINSGTEMWMQRASLYLVPPILGLGVLALKTRTHTAGAALGGLAGFLLVSLLTHDAYTGLLFFWVTGGLCLGAIALERWSFVRDLWLTATSGAPGRGPSRVWLWIAAAFFLMAVAIAVAPIDRTTLGTWRFSATDPMRPLRVSALAAAWYVVRLLRWRGVRRAGRAVRRAVMTLLTAAALRVAATGAGAGAVRQRARSCARAALAGAVAGATVFVWIYGRAMLDYHGFAPEQIYHNLMPIEPESWHDLTAVWRDLFAYDSLRPFAIVGVAAAIAWLPVFQVPVWARRLGLVAIALSVFVWIVALRFGDFALWAPITALIPSASVVRDPKRVVHLYELAAVSVAAVIAAQARANRGSSQALITVACVFLLVADGHTRRFGFSRPAELFDQVVMQDVAVDSRCGSFFVAPASGPYIDPSDDRFVPYEMHAAFLAQRLRVPTLNGYSAWYPRDWALASPQEPTYLAAVRDWTARHELTGVCVLDLTARTMGPFE